MIVVGVSATVFVILMVIGALAYLHDGVVAWNRRRARADRAQVLYGRDTSSGGRPDGRPRV